MNSAIPPRLSSEHASGTTVRNKMAMVILAVLLGSMMIVFAANAWLTINKSLRDARESLQTFADAVGQNLQGPLVFKDKSGAEEVLRSFKASPSIVDAEVRNTSNDVLARYLIARPETFTGNLIGMLPVQHELVIDQPLAIGEQALGSLRVQASLNAVWESQLRLLMWMATVAAVALCLAILMARRLSAVVVEPIQQIASTARRITSAGDYTLRVNKTSDDEVGILADEFNSMLKTINQRDIALRESEERFRSVWESSVDGMRLCDASGKIVSVNDAYCSMVGKTTEELKGRSLAEVYSVEESERILRVFVKSAAARSMSKYFEKELTLRKGNKRWFAVSNAFVDSPDNAARVLSIFRDITERKQLAFALADTERHFTALIATTPVGVFETDRDGQCIFVNLRWCELTGLSTEAAKGGGWADTLHPDDRQRVYAEWMASIAEGRPFALEYRFLRPDGSVTWVLGQSCRLNSESGELVGLLGTITDITDRKRAEAARASLESQLRESQKMQAIGTLAGGIAHDFNNILATILGNVELAREDVSSNPLALQSLDEIHKASARARALVQQILSFGRRQPTERKLIALTTVIDESVRLLRATLPSRVSLDVHCETGLPAVLADATQIQQILINMVTNAMQAMGNGAGHIDIRLDTVLLDAAWVKAHPAVRALHARQSGQTVRLAISDDGPGMDAATLARIFEPFFTTKAVDEGTGLGLSVVHGIVQTHDGAIEVDSIPGKGSTFTVYLPAAETEAGANAPVQHHLAGPATPKSGGGEHILYLDDDESLVFLVTRLLERRGFRVSGFTDQREALAALRAGADTFDLVVTDYNMPGMSGLDVACAVRAIRANLPVAIASGFIDETLQTQAAGAGVRELIFKANAVEELCEAFARLAQAIGEQAESS